MFCCRNSVHISDEVAEKWWVGEERKQPPPLLLEPKISTLLVLEPTQHLGPESPAVHQAPSTWIQPSPANLLQYLICARYPWSNETDHFSGPCSSQVEMVRKIWKNAFSESKKIDAWHIFWSVIRRRECAPPPQASWETLAFSRNARLVCARSVGRNGALRICT